jgi:hypothetical protein
LELSIFSTILFIKSSTFVVYRMNNMNKDQKKVQSPAPPSKNNAKSKAKAHKFKPPPTGVIYQPAQPQTVNVFQRFNRKKLNSLAWFRKHLGN